MGGHFDTLRLRQSVFYRIVFIFVLCLLPVYALVVFFFDQGRKVLAQEITAAMQKEVSYTLDRLETEIVRIRRLQVELVGDEDLNGLAATRAIMSDYERTMALNRLQRRILIIRGSSPFIDSISIHIFSMNMSINASAGTLGSISEIPPSRRTELASNPVVPGSFLRFGGGAISMRIGGSPDLAADDSPLYSIDVSLSVAGLRAAFAPAGEPDRGRLVLFDAEGRFVVSSGPDPRQDFEIARGAVAGSREKLVTGDGGGRTLIVRADSGALDMSLVKYVPEEVAFGTLRVYTTWLVVFTLVVVLVAVPFVLYSHTNIRKPLAAIMATFERIEGGDFDARIETAKRDEFGHLSSGFNRMAASLRNLVDQVAEQRTLAQEADLRQLQAQINPHFLYNSYFLLHRLIKQQDTQNASSFSRMMGKYFEYITRKNPHEARLADEVEHARIYAEIQARRFEGRITVEFAELPEGMREIMVPPLILQPLIENAFAHGLEKRDGGGVLRVGFSRREERGRDLLLITVDDNGASLDDESLRRLGRLIARSEEPGPVASIYNIHRRIALRFGPEAGLRAERSTLGGLRITVALPVPVRP